MSDYLPPLPFTMPTWTPLRPRDDGIAWVAGPGEALPPGPPLRARYGEVEASPRVLHTCACEESRADACAQEHACVAVPRVEPLAPESAPG